MPQNNIYPSSIFALIYTCSCICEFCQNRTKIKIFPIDNPTKYKILCKSKMTNSWKKHDLEKKKNLPVYHTINISYSLYYQIPRTCLWENINSCHSKINGNFTQMSLGFIYYTGEFHCKKYKCSKYKDIAHLHLLLIENLKTKTWTLNTDTHTRWSHEICLLTGCYCWQWHCIVVSNEITLMSKCSCWRCHCIITITEISLLPVCSCCWCYCIVAITEMFLQTRSSCWQYHVIIVITEMSVVKIFMLAILQNCISEISLMSLCSRRWYPFSGV